MECKSSNSVNIEASLSPVISTRLGKCEVCNTKDAKYTCPRCEVKTCSLRCSKIHKIELECDGARNPTKFVALNKFTDMDLQSDYKLLENISERMDSIKKNFERRNTGHIIPKHLLRLRQAAQQQRITLKFLPFKFLRHRSNTTQFNYKSKLILWHIEWIFINADNLKICDSKVSETAKLGSVLQKYFMKHEDKNLQEKLQYYQAADISGIKILLKAEQKCGKKFYELDPCETIKDNLAGKIIIEYPTIYLVLKDHAASYHVIDSDGEDDSEDRKTGNRLVQQIIRKAENNESRCKSMKNLLFSSEYSDDDDEL